MLRNRYGCKRAFMNVSQIGAWGAGEMNQKNDEVFAIQTVVRTIRKQKVILDSDLALIYGVATKALNQAVKRNIDRFPADFMFRLTSEELAELQRSRSQFVTLNRGHNIKYSPFAFTEHGAVMAGMVLNSPRATEMSIFVVRAFIRMREQLTASAVLAKRLAEIEKTLLTHDAALVDLYEQIRPLLMPPPEPPRTRVGFGVREKRMAYRARKRFRGNADE